MSNEAQGKGVRIPTLDRPPVTSPNEFTEEGLANLAYVNSVANDAAMAHDDVKMLFRCGMQFMRYLAKKYGFTIKQWPEK